MPSTPSHEQLTAVLDAAGALLCARANQMVTCVEWEDLERAVAACMATCSPDGREVFFVDPDGTLARSVTPERGEPYTHRCPLAALEAVAHAVSDAGAEGVSLGSLVAATGLPDTQANVAFAFLKERGIAGPAAKRRHAGRGGVHLDAMTEYHALREEGPDA